MANDATPPPGENRSSSDAQVRPLWRRVLLSDWVLWPLAFLAIYWVMKPSPSGPTLGQPLERTPLTDATSGERIDLPTKGPMLIEVFASWCGACKRSNSMLGTLGTPKLPYFMVSVDDERSLALRAKTSWPIHTTVLHDGQDRVSRLWRVEMLPTFILLDANGNVSRVSTGMPGPLDLHAFSEAARAR